MATPPVFIPGHEPGGPGPLARYLPPLPAGIASAWLAQLTPAGEGPEPGWVLDPFGASPGLVIEMARAGYQVLVAANNPVVRFVLESMAAPPQASELRAALAELAATFKGSERLEPHLRSLYETECAQCGQLVAARCFVWDRGAAVPSARIYHCPNCGDTGERPVTEADLARVAQLGASSGMYRSRAIERVAAMDDPDRAHAEEALAAYLPRAVYALFTLINKLENLSLHHRRLVSALLLSAFDQANTLWAYPTQRARPRQLIVPARFRENNVWLALEEAIGQWQADPERPAPALPVTTWPELPPASGGICIFEGRLKELAARQADLPVLAVVTALPRPNQAYWTLSALWAGWLWGRAAAAAFKSVLRRRRYDWAWHITALHSAFQNLAPLLGPGARCLGLVAEVEPGFLSAVLVAAAQSGLELDGVALSATLLQAQVHWRRSSDPPAETSGAEPGALEPLPAGVCLDGAQEFLLARQEPSGYLELHTAALAALVQSPARQSLAARTPADALAEVNNLLQQVTTYRSGFLRFGGSEHSLEVGQWWLRPERLSKATQQAEAYREAHAPPVEAAAPILDIPPLTDQVEVAVVRLLTRRTRLNLAELEAAIYAEFPGLLTPSPALILACLASYAHPDPLQPGMWLLNPQDQPAARRADLAAMSALLTAAGQRLGYSVQGSAPGQIPVTWSESNGEIAWAYYVIASGLTGRLLQPGVATPSQCILVLPGSRATLLNFKLENDPRLRLAQSTGWRLVKFRQMRSLVENPRFSRTALPDLLAQDPMESSEQQMTLL